MAWAGLDLLRSPDRGLDVWRVFYAYHRDLPCAKVGGAFRPGGRLLFFDMMLMISKNREKVICIRS